MGGCEMDAVRGVLLHLEVRAPKTVLFIPHSSFAGGSVPELLPFFFLPEKSKKSISKRYLFNNTHPRDGADPVGCEILCVELFWYRAYYCCVHVPNTFYNLLSDRPGL